MKIVFPMQLGGDNTPCEVASLDAFIEKLNALDSGTFPLGRNRLWHGGIHLSQTGGWHPSGAVRAIADGEIVAYRLAKEPTKATLEPEQGQPGETVDLYTSPSFCLVRHRYEAGEQSKNRCTFYSLYMHIACKNSYSSPQAARLVVKGHNVSTYEPVLEQVNPQQFRVKLRTTQQASQSRPLYAIEGAEVKLATPDADPSSYLNPQEESHPYQLVSYVSDPSRLFYIAASQLEQVFPQQPAWMTPPESKPLRYGVRNNSWLRQSASSTEGSLGLPAGSEVVVSTDRQMVTLTGGPTEFCKVKVFKAGSGSVLDSAGHTMALASQGAIGWLASNRLGAALAAEPSTPIEFDKVVDRSQNPMAVQAGEIIGHWGEHQMTTGNPNGVADPDRKAVHFEVFVAERDKQALEDCINNQARLTTGQGYLLLKAGEPVTTYRLTSDNRHSYHSLAEFGPQLLPLAVKESDVISHGANNFVRVRERTAAQGELAGEFVLVTGDTQLVSQHDWGKLGVMLIDGSHDQDGFLDKADTTTSSEEPRQKEASQFFSSLYDKLVTDRDSDGTLSGNDIKAAFADAELAGKLRRLFIKHESEWIKRESWPRLEQELTDKPNLCKYAKQVHQNMAWIDDAKVVEILGDTKPWFIHPAGMMGLVQTNKAGVTHEQLKLIFPEASDDDIQAVVTELDGNLETYKLNTPLRLRHFFSQIKGEVGPTMKGRTESFQFSPSALLSFSDYYRAHPAEAEEDGYAKDSRTNRITRRANEQAIGRKHYSRLNGNRSDHPDDGLNLRGRGLIQITGYEKYHGLFSDYNDYWLDTPPDFVNQPEKVNEMPYAIRSAIWFWLYRSVYRFDLGNGASDVIGVTNRVNGRDMGLTERQEAYELCAQVFK